MRVHLGFLFGYILVENKVDYVHYYRIGWVVVVVVGFDFEGIEFVDEVEFGFDLDLDRVEILYLVGLVDEGVTEEMELEVESGFESLDILQLLLFH
jgi:hypothetical protein